MPEDNRTDKKAEIEYHAPVREFDNQTHLVTNIGFTAKAMERYQIIWPIPSTEEECKARYDCPLSALIEAGIRQFSTRPDYKFVGFEEDGTLKPEGHVAMQTLADGYEVGKRTAGPTQKIMAAKAKQAEEELGMTHDQMVATLKRMKAEGKLDD
ncbi:hypothetical protein ES703_101523 [subsurface metagenome]